MQRATSRSLVTTGEEVDAPAMTRGSLEHPDWECEMHAAQRLTRILRALFVLSFFAAWLLLACGCASIPKGQQAIDSVEVTGARVMSASEIEEKIATVESPKFLGLFRGVIFDYELFDRFVLQRDLQRVEQFYRERGFYEAKVRAGRVVRTHDDHVRVSIEVEEGKPVLLADATLTGLEGIPRSDAVAAMQAMRGKLPRGRRFDQEDFASAEKAILGALTDRGYAFAKVERRAQVDLPGHYALAFFDAKPDRKAVLGPVIIEGLGPLPEGPVRRALALRPGDLYSSSKIQAAQQSALDLGVFASVEIEPKLDSPPPEPRVVPLTVRVEPTRLHGITLGGGLELDVIRTDIHGQIGWEARNFLGGMRTLNVQVKPGVVLYPTRLPNLQSPTRLLPMERSRAQFRQPGFIEARTSGTLSAEFNIFPVLLTPEVDKSWPVLGYRELRGAAGVDRTFWKLYTNVSYNLQTNFPFAYAGPLDPSLTSVTVSYVDLLTQFDFRNDRVHPHKGFLIGNELQVAGGIFGGNARDVRVQPEVRGYVPLARKVTLAVRGSVGFLFPRNYANTLVPNAEGQRDLTDLTRQEWVRDAQLVYFRAFYSGGASSNRGYPYRGVGPHGVVPFFNPTIAAQQLAEECAPGSPSFSLSRCALPLGGLSLWEASAEIRFPIMGALTGATFCDMSDVSPSRVDVRLNHPHLSCGVGARYDTPVGPVRLDIGYRIPGLQVPKGYDNRKEGDPGTILGVPIAVAFGIGEAF